MKVQRDTFLKLQYRSWDVQDNSQRFTNPEVTVCVLLIVLRETSQMLKQLFLIFGPAKFHRL